MNKRKIELDPGTDITAILLKIFQSSQIQTQLDSSHNLYKNIEKEKKSLNNDTSSPNICNNTSEDLENLDALLSEKCCSKKKNIKTNNENVYQTSVGNIYNLFSTLDSNKSSLNKHCIIEQELIKSISSLSSPTIMCLKETSIFGNITNFIDLRKSKKWVSYLLSDNVIRYGVIQPHFIFNKIPGWLFDAIQLSYENNLYLIYSTDMRGVNEFMGQVCSLINLHNMLSLKLETDGENYTAILIHLAGILSTNSLNPINRQGMTYPESVLQKTTFENVKRFLNKASGSDNLRNFISSSLMCVPHKSGTNSFDLLQL